MPSGHAGSSRRGTARMPLERAVGGGGGAAQRRRWEGSRRTRRRRSGRRDRRRGTRRPARCTTSRSIASPAGCPWSSLTRLKSSRSIRMHESGLPVRDRTVDLLFQAPAHRAVVHAAGDGVGAGLRARAHERERGGGLLDERAREIDGARLVEGGRGAAHEHHHRLDLAALRERQQQRAAQLRRWRSAAARSRRVPLRRRQEAAPGARDPADAGRTLGARRQVAEAPVAVEQVDGRRARRARRHRARWWTCTSSAPGESAARARARGRSCRCRRRRRRAPSAGGSPTGPAARPRTPRYPYLTRHPCPQFTASRCGCDAEATGFFGRPPPDPAPWPAPGAARRAPGARRGRRRRGARLCAAPQLAQWNVTFAYFLEDLPFFFGTKPTRILTGEA